MGLSLDMPGFEELAKKLEGLPGRVKNRVSKQALMAGAVPIEAGILQKIHSVSGTLARSMSITAGTKKGNVVVNVRPETKAEPGLVTTAKRGPNAGRRQYYPTVVELGTTTREAHPFIRPGFDMMVQTSVGVISENLRVGIEGACK